MTVSAQPHAYYGFTSLGADSVGPRVGVDAVQKHLPRIEFPPSLACELKPPPAPTSAPRAPI
jgi:hypothetical protein